MIDSPLYRLAYISSSVELLAQKELEDILARSRRNNAADGITGLLLYHDGNFFQVLEGAKDAVLACYGRIEKDLRHNGCIVLISEPSEIRRFANWDMAYVPFSRLEPSCRKGFLDLQRFRETAKMREVAQDDEVGVFVHTFLSNFRGL